MEIRLRATRRHDDLRRGQKKPRAKSRHGLWTTVTGLKKNPVKDTRPTLAEQGIDKNLRIALGRHAPSQSKFNGLRSGTQFRPRYIDNRSALTSL